MNLKVKNSRPVTGIIPAAGYASRLPKLPCSKEIYPLRVKENKNNHAGKTQVAAASLLNHLSQAGAKKAFMIIRKEKWDIPQFLEDGSEFNLNLSYIVTPPTNGTIYSILKSLPFIENDTVLLGFPDIQIYTDNPFTILLDKLHSGNADIMLGLFKAPNPQKVDMVETSPDGTLKRIEVKPNSTQLIYTWLIAAWKPSFTKAIQKNLDALRPVIKKREIYFGDIIQSSIKNGLIADTYIFNKTTFIDIGTNSDLIKSLIDANQK